jgi:AraC-like DNA-binding protein
MLPNIEQPDPIFGNRDADLSQLLPRKPLFSSQKLDWAGTLLEHHHQYTWEISEQVGFKSQSHFANVFRKHTNQTPKMYLIDTK